MPQQASSCLMILALLVSNGEASLDCTDADAPRMNNIGYVLAGYDIYFGNPSHCTTWWTLAPGPMSSQQIMLGT